MSSHGSLEAAAQDRKARLAQLKSLKRKQPSTDTPHDAQEESTALTKTKSPSPENSVATAYLSGRNYDPENRAPKLGFEESPANDVVTLEQKAAALAVEVREQAKEEDADEGPIDLFKIQPKKANWDLKRELEKKLEILNTRTDNAIAQLVRQRIENAKKEKQKEMQEKGTRKAPDDEAEEVGLDGQTLVEAMHMREREEEEEARRERQEEADML